MNLLEIIDTEIISFLLENRYVDSALDKLLSVGGDFNKLNELDKLVLLAPSKDYNKLKRLDLGKIYKELGGTFGNLMLEVRIKDEQEQRIQHQADLEYAGENGFIASYINYDNNTPQQAYVTVRFNKFIADPDYKGDGYYLERNIYLANMYPIGYDDTSEEFIKYQNKINLERKEFLDGWYDDDDEENIR